MFQEFGHFFGTMVFGLPIAHLLGIERQAIGATFSVGREPSLAIIGEKYGMQSPEGQGVLAEYLTGTVFGAVFIALLAGLITSLRIVDPLALAMGAGVGSGSMMAAASGSIGLRVGDPFGNAGQTRIERFGSPPKGRREQHFDGVRAHVSRCVRPPRERLDLRKDRFRLVPEQGRPVPGKPVFQVLVLTGGEAPHHVQQKQSRLRIVHQAENERGMKPEPPMTVAFAIVPVGSRPDEWADRIAHRRAEAHARVDEVTRSAILLQDERRDQIVHLRSTIRLRMKGHPFTPILPEVSGFPDSLG